MACRLVAKPMAVSQCLGARFEYARHLLQACVLKVMFHAAEWWRIFATERLLQDIKRAFDFDTPRYNPRAQGNSLPDYRSVMMTNIRKSNAQSNHLARGFNGDLPLRIQMQKTSVAQLPNSLLNSLMRKIDGHSFKVSGKEQQTNASSLEADIMKSLAATMMPVFVRISSGFSKTRRGLRRAGGT